MPQRPKKNEYKTLKRKLSINQHEPIKMRREKGNVSKR